NFTNLAFNFFVESLNCLRVICIDLTFQKAPENIIQTGLIATTWRPVLVSKTRDDKTWKLRLQQRL
ncbi:hypothetical protein WN55_02708, partial [Dufourea novaeangliae]